MRVSRYQHVWERLKRDKELKLAVPAKFHPRMRKAIIKRKDLDLNYKLLMAEAKVRPVLAFTFEGDMITVKLDLPLTWDNL